MGQKMEDGVDIVGVALTIPDGLSFWVFVLCVIGFSAWLIYLALKH
jgi:hypothetical protein